MARIAIGGFQHETNTFAPTPASLADFEAPDAWPGLTRGAAMFEAIAGINLPAAGFVQEARALQHQLLPLTWCSAQPSGKVTRDAFERIAGLLVDDLLAHGSVDAVYLDLHGAMVAEHCDDADGEILRRIRAVVGPGVPVIASLDFHANFSHADGPAGDGAGVVSHLPACGHGGMRRAGGARDAGRAARAAGDAAPRAARLPGAAHVAIHAGGAAAIADDGSGVCRARRRCCPPVSRQASRRQTWRTAGLRSTPAAPMRAVVAVTARRLADALRRREHEFSRSSCTPSSRRSRNCGAHTPRAGAPSSWRTPRTTPGPAVTPTRRAWSRPWSRAGCRDVLAGVFCDPDAAAMAHAAGAGASFDLRLGARTGTAGETPLEARCTVLALGDGRFTGTGPFYRGGRFELGPMALLEVGGVHVAVASRKQQAADQAMFRHLRAEPADYAVLALKSSVHFRADFGPTGEPHPGRRGPGPQHCRSGQAAVSQAEARHADEPATALIEVNCVDRGAQRRQPVHSEIVMRRILVAIDGSETALRALDFAVQQARLSPTGGAPRAERPADAEQLHRGGDLRDRGAHPPGRHRAGAGDPRRGRRAAQELPVAASSSSRPRATRPRRLPAGPPSSAANRSRWGPTASRHSGSSSWGRWRRRSCTTPPCR